MRGAIAAWALLAVVACDRPTRGQLVGDADPARAASLQRMNEGTALIENGRPRAGAAALREAVRMDPDNRDAWLALGSNHYNAGRYLDARRAFERAADGKGAASEAEVARGMGLALVGLASEAEDPNTADELVHESLSWLEGEASSLATAQLLAGTLHEDLGAVTAANRAYRRAIKLDPTDARAYARLGALYADQGFFAEAIEVLRTGTRLAATPNVVWVAMGRALAIADDLPGAVDAYRTALALDADATDATFGLGMALADLGEIDEAVPLLERYLEVEPEDRPAHLRAAEWRLAQLHLQQLERAPTPLPSPSPAPTPEPAPTETTGRR